MTQSDLSTRSGWEGALGRVLAVVLERATPGCAGVRLPGDLRSPFGEALDRFEAFARSMWGAGAWLSTSSTGRLRMEGTTVDLAGFYRTGVVNGTDPWHPESWHRLLVIPQTLVEASAVAWNVLLARTHLWDPLTRREKKQMLAWLGAVTRIPPYDCNWRLFPVVIQTVIKLLGGRYDQARVKHELDRIEEFYFRDGWYDDHHSKDRAPSLDYYNATVFHPHLLFWAHMDAESDPPRAARVRERASLFLERFPHWFGADGSFPCFGRSAIYRCAVLHALAWGVLTDTSPIPLGQARRLSRLVTQRFLDAPGVFGPHGELTPGFTREHRPLADHYSGCGSPYELTKAFAILAMTADHPFWRADEQVLPVEAADFTLPTAGGAFLLHGSQADGHVQLVNGRSLLYAKKYSNLSYSTHFGYELDRHRELEDEDPFGEAALTFSCDGEAWYGRRSSRSLGCEDGVLLTESLYALADRGADVRTISAITFLGDAQVRVHRVEASHPVYAREGGFACGWSDRVLPRLVGGPTSFAAAEDRASAIRSVCGYDHASRPADSGSNVLYPHSAVPHLTTKQAKSGLFHLASVSLARAARFEPTDLPDLEPAHFKALIERVESAAESAPAEASVVRARAPASPRRAG